MKQILNNITESKFISHSDKTYCHPHYIQYKNMTNQMKVVGIKIVGNKQKNMSVSHMPLYCQFIYIF